MLFHVFTIFGFFASNFNLITLLLIISACMFFQAIFFEKIAFQTLFFTLDIFLNSVLKFLTFFCLKSLNLFIALSVLGLSNVFQDRLQRFEMASADLDIDYFIPGMDTVTSESYYRHFIKKNFIKNQLLSHYTEYSVFIAKMQTASSRAHVDEEYLDKVLIDLSLQDFVLGALEFDDCYIMGFQFINFSAKKKFTEFIENDIANKFVILDPVQAKRVDFHIKPFPFLFTETNLQNQLINYGRVINFKYATKNLAGKQILKNELYFTLELKEDVERNSVPAYIKHNNSSFALASRLLPPICSLCRTRGHARDSCDYVWCTPCSQKKLRIHECAADIPNIHQPDTSLPTATIPAEALSFPFITSPLCEEVQPDISSQSGDDITPAQPTNFNKRKNRAQRRKLLNLSMISQSDTDELTDEQILAPMDTSVGTSKRKLDQINTTTSEEDQGDNLNSTSNDDK